LSAQFHFTEGVLAISSNDLLRTTPERSPVQMGIGSFNGGSPSKGTLDTITENKRSNHETQKCLESRIYEYKGLSVALTTMALCFTKGFGI